MIFLHFVMMALVYILMLAENVEEMELWPVVLMPQLVIITLLQIAMMARVCLALVAQIHQLVILIPQQVARMVLAPMRAAQIQVLVTTTF
jgi:hypothetical protein